MSYLSGTLERFVCKPDECLSEVNSPSVGPVCLINRVGSSGERNNVFVNSGHANVARDFAVKFTHLSREFFDVYR